MIPWLRKLANGHGRSPIFVGPDWRISRLTGKCYLDKATLAQNVTVKVGGRYGFFIKRAVNI